LCHLCQAGTHLVLLHQLGTGISVWYAFGTIGVNIITMKVESNSALRSNAGVLYTLLVQMMTPVVLNGYQ
jgi:hypothetical protein